MHEVSHEKDKIETEDTVHDDTRLLLAEIRSLKEEVQELRQAIKH